MAYFQSIRGGAWAAAALGVLAGTASAADRLPALNADLAQTSVSGLSSGAAMAVQFHVAHSSFVKGAGIIAGSPYYCAENSGARAIRNCMQPDGSHPVPDPAHLKDVTDRLGRSGAVDDPANLQNSKVWLFSGKADKVVRTPVMDAARDYYGFYLPEERIAYRNDLNAGHALPTDDYGGPCAYTGPPFVDDCDFDAAGTLLGHIHGPLNPPAEPRGRYIEFDQREFLPDGDAHAHSLADSGYAYVPEACTAERCRVHVALHGCMQQAGAVGDSFYRHGGYNRWAESNRLIVLYPQTITRFGWGPPFWNFNVVWNPNGCWDWWGYDSAEYHTRNGAQMRAIRGMLERLAARENTAGKR
jgi:poly(3-hydroxybutyrate) depolymerase